MQITQRRKDRGIRVCTGRRLAQRTRKQMLLSEEGVVKRELRQRRDQGQQKHKNNFGAFLLYYNIATSLHKKKKKKQNKNPTESYRNRQS